MNTDRNGPLIAARSFFKQMRSYGYSPDQIIRIINELLELVTSSVREGKPAAIVEPATREEEMRRLPDVR